MGGAPELPLPPLPFAAPAAAIPALGLLLQAALIKQVSTARAPVARLLMKA